MSVPLEVLEEFFANFGTSQHLEKSSMRDEIFTTEDTEQTRAPDSIVVG
jgi:hypothetical protein